MLEKLLLAFLELWDMFLLLSPYFLMGLFLAGLLHVLASKRQISAMIGDQGMKGVLISSTLGITVPICTCGVAPLGVELQRKGASRPAIISFLITTPETAIDTIMVTLGLMGPFMAISRPIFAYCMGIAGGFFAIGILKDEEKTEEIEKQCEICHDSEHHANEVLDIDQNELDFVGFKTFYHSILYIPKRIKNKIADSAKLYSWYRPQISLPEHRVCKAPSDTLPLSEIFRRVFNYSFKQLADEVLPGLILGMGIALLIFYVLPDDLSKYGLGKGFFSYFIMLAIGMPLYVCASASTPIAAAFIFQGVSPGAAMVFLLAAPSTNLTTLAILGRYFGMRFLNVYLFTVMVGGVLSGMLFDYLLHTFDWKVVANLAPARGPIAGMIEWGSAIALISLIIWRSWKGRVGSEFREMTGNLGETLPRLNGIDPSEPWYANFSKHSRLVRFGLPLALLIYTATGLTVVPIGAVGYVRLFGHVVERDLKPGLHYIPPQPIAVMDLFYSAYPYQVTVGVIIPDEEKAKNEKSTEQNIEVNNQPILINQAAYDKQAQVDIVTEDKENPSKKFGLGPLKNGTVADQARGEFFSGDENLLDVAISVQYTVANPYKYFYRINSPESFVADRLRSKTLDMATTGKIIKLLSQQREEFEESVKENLIPDFEQIGAKIVTLNIVWLHPPAKTMYAFRDTMSAREDRETSNLKALKMMVETILSTRGNAQVEVQRAEALALSEKLQAEGMAISIEARAQIVSQYRKILEDLLWIETSERVMSKREVYLLPPSVSPQKFSLWKNAHNFKRLSEEKEKNHKEKSDERSN
jgi:uncharacterized membrane protein YraQ (UPF0718 family)/regulator of protease activity HflC (stomatin/prohibitin superfamily)